MANQTSGYIKISRRIVDWEWADDPNTLALWIHILVCANWEPRKWHGMSVDRGVLITSVSKLAVESGMSVRVVRTGLSRLIESDAITVETTSKWSKISVCKYDTYQCWDDTARQADDKPTTSQKDNNLKESVERIYALYPTKCPVSGRATGKGTKDKRKIESLLKDGHSEEELTATITRYVQDCTKDQSYIKNFQTFLNNLPDYGTSDIWSQEPEQTQQEPVVYYQSLEELEAARRAKKNK